MESLSSSLHTSVSQLVKGEQKERQVQIVSTRQRLSVRPIRAARKKIHQLDTTIGEECVVAFDTAAADTNKLDGGLLDVEPPALLLPLPPPLSRLLPLVKRYKAVRVDTMRVDCDTFVADILDLLAISSG